MDLHTDTSLVVDISDALSERDKVKFTVHTKVSINEDICENPFGSLLIFIWEVFFTYISFQRDHDYKYIVDIVWRECLLDNFKPFVWDGHSFHTFEMYKKKKQLCLKHLIAEFLSNLEHQLFWTVKVSTCVALPCQYWYQRDVFHLSRIFSLLDVYVIADFRQLYQNLESRNFL